MSPARRAREGRPLLPMYANPNSFPGTHASLEGKMGQMTSPRGQRATKTCLLSASEPQSAFFTQFADRRKLLVRKTHETSKLPRKPLPYKYLNGSTS